MAGPYLSDTGQTMKLSLPSWGCHIDLEEQKQKIIEKVNENNIELQDVKDFLAVSGRGVKGKIDGANYYGSNLSFMKENNVNIQDYEKKVLDLSNQGKICLYFAKENNMLGVIAVSDTVKNTSKKAIENLKKQKKEVVMITGDNKLVAESIAKEVGIDKVIAEVLPQDKEKEVSKLQENGKKVAFVGDGINDSPALVKADVGLAIGSGTDIAIESADVVLMQNSLIEVDTAIALSKAVIGNIKMNLFWAFFYNCLMIPIAMGMLKPFGIFINPMIASLAMVLSSITVILNTLIYFCDLKIIFYFIFLHIWDWLLACRLGLTTYPWGSSSGIHHHDRL